MNSRPALLAPLLLCACLSTPAGAQTAAAPAAAAAASAPMHAGVIKRSTGLVTLKRAGQMQAAAAGALVMVGDTLHTGPDGSAGITLADDTRLTAGPNSELEISEFSFNSTTQDGSLLASLWRGTLNMVTGLIGKKAPEKVNVQTRTVVLGVRGTELIVEAGGAEK